MSLKVTRTGNGNAEFEFESFGGRRDGWSWEDCGIFTIRDQPLVNYGQSKLNTEAVILTAFSIRGRCSHTSIYTH